MNLVTYRPVRTSINQIRNSLLLMFRPIAIDTGHLRSGGFLNLPKMPENSSIGALSAPLAVTMCQQGLPILMMIMWKQGFESGTVSVLTNLIPCISNLFRLKYWLVLDQYWTVGLFLNLFNPDLYQSIKNYLYIYI